MICDFRKERLEGRLFGTRRPDRVLKFLEFLHLVLRLRGPALFPIKPGKPKMCLCCKRGIFFEFNYL
jgi:hypothetical protein